MPLLPLFDCYPKPRIKRTLWHQHASSQSQYDFSILDHLNAGVALYLDYWSLVSTPGCAYGRTTRTLLFWPGPTSTCAMGHLVGAVCSSRKHTILPSSKSFAGFFHLERRFTVLRYSFDHLLQKWLFNFCQSCQSLNNVRVDLTRASQARPLRASKWGNAGALVLPLHLMILEVVWSSRIKTRFNLSQCRC